MKRLVMLLFLGFITLTHLPAQTFSFKPDTTYAFHESGLIQLHGTIINLSGRSTGLKMIRTRNILPENWQSSMCVGLGCYPPDTDSILFSVPGESEVAFYLDVAVNADNPGRAEIDIYLESSDDTQENVQYTFIVENVVSSVETPQDGAFRLPVNFPNPFNPVTQIRFYVETPASQAILSVYNSAGQLIYGEMLTGLSAGYHSFIWAGIDVNNHIAGSGMYLYSIRSGEHNYTGKMSLLR